MNIKKFINGKEDKKMWKSININIQNVEYSTDKATLIKMPNNSDYKDYKFWHPSKLIRSGKNSYAVSLSYTDEFTFRLIKYGKGKYNQKQIINEIEIDVEKFEKAFAIMNENISYPKNNENSYLIVKEPEKIDLEVKVRDELKNE